MDVHSIIQIPNSSMGLTTFYGIFSNIFRIQTEWGKYQEISYGILSIPEKIVINMNDFM